jgi:rieske iron-sulfur protein
MLLMTALGMGLGLPLVRMRTVDVAVAQANDPKVVRPQAGDRFVFASGEKVGKMITPEDLRSGEPPVTAYSMDPGTGVVRDGSRLNQILLLRLSPEDLNEETRGRAADGIVAYSAVCTHANCDITVWRSDAKMLRCPCHESEFDPQASAHVSGGPAPRRLPALPLKIVDGVLTAAGTFSGRVGFQGGS